MSLFKILSLLAVALLVLIPLIERYGPQPDDAKLRRINRWVIPLVATLLLLQLLALWWRS